MTPPDWTSAATRPEMDAGLQYHIRCKRGDVERYVLLPGDPERVDLIAAEWDEAIHADIKRRLLELLPPIAVEETRADPKCR